MNKQRLESARDFLRWLDEAPEGALHEHFDMELWYSEASQDCDTAACAIGWIAQVEDNGGLRLRRRDNSGAYPVLDGLEADDDVPLAYQPWFSVRTYFGIDQAAAGRIFDACEYYELDEEDGLPIVRYISPGEVADAIDHYLAANG